MEPSRPAGPLHAISNPSIPLLAPCQALSSSPRPSSQSSKRANPLQFSRSNLKSLPLRFCSHFPKAKRNASQEVKRERKELSRVFPGRPTNDFDPFTKLNLNSSLDRANSKTYNPWEMISRLQTIAKTVPFHPKLYKRSPVNRSPGILTETITASLLQGNHRMNSARLQV